MNTPGLRILVIDEDVQRAQALSQVLRDTGYEVVTRVKDGEYLPNLVADAEPDLILIDIASPDRDTLEQLTLIHENTPRPVVMFAQDDDERTIESAVRAGVSAYVVDGLSGTRVKPVIDVAIAHFRQHQAMRVELEKTRTSLEERKYIDRAKSLLMRRRKLSEDEAYAMLRKIAMDRKQRLGQVSRMLLDAAEALEGVQV